MIAKKYQKILEKELNRSTYLLLTLVVASLQLFKQVKLEWLAEALPLPILFESRRQKLRRFLRKENLGVEKIWFPCVKCLLRSMFKPKDTRYLALDRTSWGEISILMVSVIWNQRAWPVYWIFLSKKGSSNLKEQQEVLGKSLEVLSGKIDEYIVVVLGDREFCSPKLASWLSEKGTFFCLIQKCDTKIAVENGLYKELRDWGLTPGMNFFINDRQVSDANRLWDFQYCG